MAVSLGSEYYTLKKKLKDVPESETGQSSVSKSTEAQDEKKEIHKRHQKVLEARAKLHVEAGVGFLARFKHSAEGQSLSISLHPYEVYNEILVPCRCMLH